MPDIWTSAIKQDVSGKLEHAKKSAADSKVATANPSDLIRPPIASRMPSSSSMIEIWLFVDNPTLRTWLDTWRVRLGNINIGETLVILSRDSSYCAENKISWNPWRRRQTKGQDDYTLV
jgi:hypothetical protein